MTAAIIGAVGCVDGPTSPTSQSATRGTSTPAELALKAGKKGFGFYGTARGFPTGAVILTGGGSYQAATASNTVPSETEVVSGEGFRCTEGVAQGPLSGCVAGQGVRWDTAQLLASTNFRCTGADATKTAITGPETTVLLADFYRAGDGVDESFTAQMIVSQSDLAPDVAGEQNIWVQGVGCGSAVVHFGE